MHGAKACSPSSRHRYLYMCVLPLLASQRIGINSVFPAQDAMQQVVIKHIQTLEQGILLEFADGCSRWCYGSIFMILGDHPFLAKIGGTLDNTSEFF